MPVSKDEDRAMAKAARSAIARTTLDISELVISCSGAYVALDGRVRKPRGHTGEIHVRKEFQQILVMIRGVRGVKEAFGDRVTIIEE